MEEQKNEIKKQDLKWVILGWLASALVAIGIVNLTSVRSIFPEGGIAEFIGQIIGSAVATLGIGIIMAAFIRIFAHKANFWVTVLTVGIIVNLVGTIGLLSKL